MKVTYESIAKRIDHSLLNPTMTDEDLAGGCRIAAEYQVASVCIKPYAVSMAKRLLDGSGVAVGTTIGFPHGGHTTAVKRFESERALDDGATELDMVVNIGEVLSGHWDVVQDDIATVVDAAHARQALVKVIFENCYLNDDLKRRLCTICGELKVDYVKTSTGYGSGGASAADLQLMRAASPAHVKLKAAGGIRTLDGVFEAVQLGCDRIGASKTKEMLDDLRNRLGSESFLVFHVEQWETSRIGGAY